MLIIPDVINMSISMSDLKEKLSVFTKQNIETIEKLSVGQSKMNIGVNIANA